MEWLAAYDDAKVAKEIIIAISNIVDEGNFYAREAGLEFMAMDESRVAMVILNMPATLFQKYDFKPPDGKETIVMGINFSELKKIIQRAKSKDSVIFSLKKERDRFFFTVTFYRGTLEERSLQRSFALPLIEIPEEKIPIKELQYDVSIEFAPASALGEIISDASVIGEDLRIITNASKKELKFVVESDTGGFYEYLAPLDREETIVEFNVKNDAESLYSIDFLKKFMRASRVSEMVRLEYSKNMPLKLTFMIGGGVELSYLLAPRIV
ncbi:MAG: proliferating cell nuclear antigen (pcna) [Candidatus Njordarchaeia archaeon]